MSKRAICLADLCKVVHGWPQLSVNTGILSIDTERHVVKCLTSEEYAFLVSLCVSIIFEANI